MLDTRNVLKLFKLYFSWQWQCTMYVSRLINAQITEMIDYILYHVYIWFSFRWRFLLFFYWNIDCLHLCALGSWRWWVLASVVWSCIFRITGSALPLIALYLIRSLSIVRWDILVSKWLNKLWVVLCSMTLSFNCTSISRHRFTCNPVFILRIERGKRGLTLWHYMYPLSTVIDMIISVMHLYYSGVTHWPSINYVGRKIQNYLYEQTIWRLVDNN